MTNSLTTALEEMTINNEQLGREIDVLKTENDGMKEENKQLTTLLNKMAVNNENQIQQINSQCSENAQLKTKVQQLEVSLVSGQGSHELFTYTCHTLMLCLLIEWLAK